MRRETAGQSPQGAARAVVTRSSARRSARGVALSALLSLLLAPPSVLAEPAARPAPGPARAGVDLKLPAAIALSAELSPEAAPTPGEAPQPSLPAVSAAPPPSREPATPARIELEDLFYEFRAPLAAPTLEESTDDALAAAVALGTPKDLKKRKPFRKKSRDLFRAERPVEIGDSEVLLRLRLRPKRRETVSLEVRF